MCIRLHLDSSGPSTEAEASSAQDCRFFLKAGPWPLPSPASWPPCATGSYITEALMCGQGVTRGLQSFSKVLEPSCLGPYDTVLKGLSWYKGHQLLLLLLTTASDLLPSHATRSAASQITYRSCMNKHCRRLGTQGDPRG